jgi:hypothetical protein
MTHLRQRASSELAGCDCYTTAVRPFGCSKASQQPRRTFPAVFAVLKPLARKTIFVRGEKLRRPLSEPSDPVYNDDCNSTRNVIFPATHNQSRQSTTCRSLQSHHHRQGLPFYQQGLSAPESVGLKHHPDFLLWKLLPRRLQCRPDLRRVMGVVVINPQTPHLAQEFEAPFHTLESAQGLARRPCGADDRGVQMGMV